MQEQLNQIAEQTGVPADLLERAARSRAEKQGVAVEAVVAGWAGGETPAAAPAAAEPAPAAPAAPAESGAGKLPEALLRRSAAAKAKREGRPLDEILVEMGLSPEGASSEAPAAPAAPAAAATPVATAAKSEEPAAEEEPVVADEPEPVFAGFPRWLAASFIIIPMIALLYAGLAPNGPDCGTSGQLAINPITGEAESCDGGTSPFYTQGEVIYETVCAACHGADGSGGLGPSFLGGAVLETFSACTDHIEWVTIGSTDWPNATYGDNAKPVLATGVAMPGYQSTLSAQEIAAVSLYERVAFSGEDIAEAEASCGLVAGAEG